MANENDWLPFWTIVFVAIFIFILSLICSYGCLPHPQSTALPAAITNLPEQLPQVIYRTHWMISPAIAVIGIGAFFCGKSWGIKLIVAGIVVIVILLTISKYALLFSICGLLAVAGLFSYTIYEHFKEKNVLNKAVTEIVQGIEQYKSKASTVSAVTIDTLRKAFDDIQSDTTKKIVENIKNGNNK